MKIERTIMLSKNDLETLRKAAYILEKLSSGGDGRCWTARDIRQICDKSYESEIGYKVIYE